MPALIRACLAAFVAVAAGLTSADLAAACSCADRDERDRLEDGEIGVLGRVVERRELYDREHATLDGRPLVRGWEYRLRVQRGVGARFGRTATVRLPADGCEPAPTEVGRRLAVFVRKRSYGWLTHGCSVADPGDFERALRPYPRARGEGRLALLAGGSFGTARVMALDARGRILGYGSGAGEVQQISVCPGALTAAELVVRRHLSVAVRDLRSLQVLWSVKLPMRKPALYEGGATVRCSDPGAAAVHAAALEDTPRSGEMTRIFRLAPAGATQIASVRGYGARLGLQSAYLTSARRLLAVGLSDGQVRRLGRLRYYAEPAEESPDGRWLAFHDGERLRLLDLGGGRERSAPARYAGAIAWLSNDRFFLRRGGEGRLYDTRLRLIRRYPFFRLLHEAQVGDRLFGTDGFRLAALDLTSGKRPTVAQLPDRGIVELVGITGGPQVAADRAAPELGFPARASAANGPCSAKPAATRLRFAPYDVVKLNLVTAGPRPAGRG